MSEQKTKATIRYDGELNLISDDGRTFIVDLIEYDRYEASGIDVSRWVAEELLREFGLKRADDHFFEVEIEIRVKDVTT